VASYEQDAYGYVEAHIIINNIPHGNYLHKIFLWIIRIVLAKVITGESIGRPWQQPGKEDPESTISAMNEIEDVSM